MVQIGNRTICGHGKNVVAAFRCTQCFKMGFIIATVAGRTQQGGKCSARTGSVGNDFARISRHGFVVEFQVTDRSLQIYDGGWCLAVGGCPSACAGRSDHITFRQGRQSGIRGLGCFTAPAEPRFARLGRHITANLVREKNRCSFRSKTANRAAAVISFRYINIDNFIFCINGIPDVNNTFIRAEFHASAIDFKALLSVFLFGKIQVVACRAVFHRRTSDQACGQRTCQ